MPHSSPTRQARPRRGPDHELPLDPPLPQITGDTAPLTAGAWSAPRTVGACREGRAPAPHLLRGPPARAPARQSPRLNLPPPPFALAWVCARPLCRPGAGGASATRPQERRAATVKNSYRQQRGHELEDLWRTLRRPLQHSAKAKTRLVSGQKYASRKRKGTRVERGDWRTKEREEGRYGTYIFSRCESDRR